MIHAREDYNRIQDPALEDSSLLGPGSTPIGKDEPVILFRAQDKHFVQILNFYYETLEKFGEAEADVFECLENHMVLAEEWQDNHPTKVPDLPKTQ
jgi:hypothetical protein